MTLDTLLDRLQLCNAEIPGIVRSLRLQPTKPTLPGAYPLVFITPGAMTQETLRESAGQYFVSRRFQLTVMVAKTAMVSLDNSDEGSRLIASVIPFLDAVIDYYMNHPFLNTEAGLGELGLVENVHIIDSGPLIFQGPDGENWAGTKPIITIAERRIPSQKRLS